MIFYHIFSHSKTRQFCPVKYYKNLIDILDTREEITFNIAENSQ